MAGLVQSTAHLKLTICHILFCLSHKKKSQFLQKVMESNENKLQEVYWALRFELNR